MHKAMVSGLVFLVVGAVSATPWWDNFPRLVDDNAVNVVSNYHGNIAMNGTGQDPCWGSFYQRTEIANNAAQTKAFEKAGIKQIGYFEAYGQNYCVVSELGEWNGTNLTPVLHQHWSWKDYGGGPIRWLGVHDYFSEEEYARPFTRSNPDYSSPAATYPDGTEAIGYNGSASDPRNSRVYDALCSKNILGELEVDFYDYQDGPTNGLIYVSETDDYSGMIMLRKDSACPFWHDYTYASVFQAASAGGDGMWTDNYGAWDSLGSQPVLKAFGEWSVARFRDHLKKNFSAEEVSEFGVTDVAAFDVREYFKSVATERGWDGANLNAPVWSSLTWLDDPLWRAYLIFKRQSGAEALSKYYATVKSAAKAAGKSEFLVAGNDMPGFNFGWCRGDLDMVSTELAMGWQLCSGATGITPPPVGRYAPLYKLAREHAKSRFVNVWLYTHHYVDELSHSELCNVLYYEMLATHTLPRFDPGNPHISGDEKTNAAFFKFVERVAPVYGKRLPFEEIGLYYSSSSVLRQMTPGGYADHTRQPHQFSLWGWGTALGELHHQYRPVPEWKLTAETLSTLRLLIIPNADVFDPTDVSLLKAWTERGGRLIITGEHGTYLPESGNFARNPAGSALAALTNSTNVVFLPETIGLDYFLAYEKRPALLAQFSETLDAALTGATPGGITKTTASSRTGITLYEDEAAGKFFIDVNNFDIDPKRYSMTATDVIAIEVVCPTWLRGKSLKAAVISPQAKGPQVKLLPVPSADRIRIKLSPVEYYAGIIIEEMK